MMVETKGNMRVVILTPYKRLLDLSHVTELYFPTEYGSIGVLPTHAPLVTIVGIGLVLYTQNNVSGFFKVAGGVCEITGSSVTLLVDVGEDGAQIDIDRARRSLERARTRLAIKDGDNIHVKRAEISQAKALARLEASELYKKNRNSQENKSV
jgi:F-type H+-transporting ATPase subunit epsilon